MLAEQGHSRAAPAAAGRHSPARSVLRSKGVGAQALGARAVLQRGRSVDALAQLALGGGGAGTGAVLGASRVGAQALGARAVLHGGGGVDAQHLRKDF